MPRSPRSWICSCRRTRRGFGLTRRKRRSRRSTSLAMRFCRRTRVMGKGRGMRRIGGCWRRSGRGAYGSWILILMQGEIGIGIGIDVRVRGRDTPREVVTGTLVRGRRTMSDTDDGARRSAGRDVRRNSMRRVVPRVQEVSREQLLDLRDRSSTSPVCARC